MGEEFEWLKELDDRQRKELDFAGMYAHGFAHGTDGHHRLLLIAKLRELLNKAERERKGYGDQSGQST